jgi:chromosome segregation ATPase
LSSDAQFLNNDFDDLEKKEALNQIEEKIESQ